MLVPIEWLNDYIDIDVSDEEFCDRMIINPFLKFFFMFTEYIKRAINIFKLKIIK